MRLTKLIVENFRSFKDPTVIDLRNFTALIGANSSGKTAVMQALTKLFGKDAKERLVQRADFHVPKGTDPKDIKSATLSIEAIFEFSELAPGAAGTTAKSTVPPVFEQMVAGKTGEIPYVRIRLLSEWQRGTSLEGDVETKIVFVTVPMGTAEAENHLVPLSLTDRANIQLIYVPAVRDPLLQLRHHSGAILWRSLKTVKWSDKIKDQVKADANALNSLFGDEPGIQTIQGLIEGHWQGFHKEKRYSNIDMGFAPTEIEELLKRVELTFRPTPDERPFSVEQLGDGLRSLFYISLVCSLLDLEGKLQDPAVSDKLGLSTEDFTAPALTILAIEEPENHLSPHLLGRAVENLIRTSKQMNAQVLITSHTPAIIQRLEPEDLRHLRLDNSSETTLVSTIKLPSEADEAFKYVKEAVRAYPELYFAQLVILGEGDTEEIVLPKVLRSTGKHLDQNKISVVPLGGRHVNHFWKLLDQLSIPYVTLLDLDRERWLGGWGRVKYVLKQLLALGADRSTLLQVDDGQGGSEVLSDKELDEMHKWTLSITNMEAWLERIRQYDVFFSSPLDMDFLMLQAYQTQYGNLLDDEEKQIPDKTTNKTEYDAAMVKALDQVLKGKRSDGSSYGTAEKELFVWYNQLFLRRGKPATHIMALSGLDEATFISKLPEPLRALSNRVEAALKRDDDGQTNIS